MSTIFILYKYSSFILYQRARLYLDAYYPKSSNKQRGKLIVLLFRSIFYLVFLSYFIMFLCMLARSVNYLGEIMFTSNLDVEGKKEKYILKRCFSFHKWFTDLFFSSSDTLSTSMECKLFLGLNDSVGHLGKNLQRKMGLFLDLPPKRKDRVGSVVNLGKKQKIKKELLIWEYSLNLKASRKLQKKMEHKLFLDLFSKVNASKKLQIETESKLFLGLPLKFNDFIKREGHFGKKLTLAHKTSPVVPFVYNHAGNKKISTLSVFNPLQHSKHYWFGSLPRIFDDTFRPFWQHFIWSAARVQDKAYLFFGIRKQYMLEELFYQRGIYLAEIKEYANHFFPGSIEKKENLKLKLVKLEKRIFSQNLRALALECPQPLLNDLASETGLTAFLNASFKADEYKLK